MAKKLTRIFVQEHSLTVIRRSSIDRGWCPLCQSEVDAIPVESQLIARTLQPLALRDCLAQGKLHALCSDSAIHICLGSLLRYLTLQTQSELPKEKL